MRSHKRIYTPPWIRGPASRTTQTIFLLDNPEFLKKYSPIGIGDFFFIFGGPTGRPIFFSRFLNFRKKVFNFSHLIGCHTSRDIIFFISSKHASILENTHKTNTRYIFLLTIVLRWYIASIGYR